MEDISRRHSTNQCFDRFIPFRPRLNIDSAHARLMSSASSGEGIPGQYQNNNAKNYWKMLAEALREKDERILPTSSTPTKLTSGCNSSWNNSACSSPDEGYCSPPVKAEKRKVSTSPESIMDMPRLRDDFYTNVLDWGKHNTMAVALQQTTYLWNASTRASQKIEMVTDSLYVSSLCWDHSGSNLAIAASDGYISLLAYHTDGVKSTVNRYLTGKGPIGVVKWTEFGVISGNRKGSIDIHDPRIKGPEGHTHLVGPHREVCGLSLAEGTSYLASGRDDGVVTIWDLRSHNVYRTIEGHTACAKAVAWCPWRSSIIASGGGSNDGHIRLWHVHTGEKMGEIFTKSQVCSILWSDEYHELVSAHGTPKPETNDIVLWDMRRFEFEPVARLRQHLGRPLHLALSPDKTTLASAGADEALCLWKCFPTNRSHPTSNRSPLSLHMSIR